MEIIKRSIKFIFALVLSCVLLPVAVLFFFFEVMSSITQRIYLALLSVFKSLIITK